MAALRPTSPTATLARLRFCRMSDFERKRVNGNKSRRLDHLHVGIGRYDCGFDSAHRKLVKGARLKVYKSAGNGMCTMSRGMSFARSRIVG